MAIELTDELLELQRAANRAHAEATAGGYSAEGWAPWMQAAERVQSAVTEHAKATRQNRYELEMELKRRAREG